MAIIILSSLLLLSILHSAFPSRHTITSIPLYVGPEITFSQYSGYIQVNKDHDRELFYWYVESASDPKKDPVVMWLNGGPGCSSMYGLLVENGPFLLSEDGQKVHPNPHSWNRHANMLYVDSPAGVGYSYTKDKSDILDCNDNRTADDMWIFLQGFFDTFPEFRSNDFYIAAESYGGHYAPTMGVTIQLNNMALEPSKRISLAGILVGNGVTDDPFDYNSIPLFMKEHSLVSLSLYDQAYDACEGDFYHGFHQGTCANAWNALYRSITGLNQYNIYSECEKDGGLTNNNDDDDDDNLLLLLSRDRRPWFRSSFFPKKEFFLTSSSNHCENGSALMTYLNSPDVLKSLHIHSESLEMGLWMGCNVVLGMNYDTTFVSVIPQHELLLHLGYRILFYSGDIDIVVNALGTQMAVDEILSECESDSLLLPEMTQWIVNDRIAGWSKVGYHGNLTFATIRGSGHMVPFDQPERALVLFEHFINNNPLPSKKGN